MVKRFGIIIAVALFVFVVAGCRRADSSNVWTTPGNIQETETRVDMEALEASYQSSLNDILRPYWETGQVGGVKEKLLALIVPPKYLKLHLSLVLGVDLIEEGMQAADESKVESGKKKIDGSVKEFPWIKS